MASFLPCLKLLQLHRLSAWMTRYLDHWKFQFTEFVEKQSAAFALWDFWFPDFPTGARDAVHGIQMSDSWDSLCLISWNVELAHGELFASSSPRSCTGVKPSAFCIIELSIYWTRRGVFYRIHIVGIPVTWTCTGAWSAVHGIQMSGRWESFLFKLRSSWSELIASFCVAWIPLICTKL